MKANGKPSETPPPENEDIAKLLRALNEDLRAEPLDDEVEDEAEEPAGRGLPLGKIALALVAAGGIAVAVVAFDPGGKAPETAGDGQSAPAASAPMVPAPAITRASPNSPGNGAPEPMITRAPASQAPASQAPAPQAPGQAPAQVATVPPAASPPPPTAAQPVSPPPVLKVPEPPAVPATAPTMQPKPHAAAPTETAPPPAPAKPEQNRPEPSPANTARETAARDGGDTGSLQAMLAPPKDGREAKRPPAESAPAAPQNAPQTAPQAASPPPPVTKATPSAAVPAGRYTVQVGTFQMTANADSLAQRLKGGGFQAYTVDWTDGANRSWRAVRVGGFPDPAAAKREAEQLKTKMGLNPVVVTTR